jgi:hypothetical protein
MTGWMMIVGGVIISISQMATLCEYSGVYQVMQMNGALNFCGVFARVRLR